jgi:hypothetical protein
MHENASREIPSSTVDSQSPSDERGARTDEASSAIPSSEIPIAKELRMLVQQAQAGDVQRCRKFERF